MKRYVRLSIALLILFFLGIALANLDSKGLPISDKTMSTNDEPVLDVAQAVVDRGQLLYKNHCGACHTESVHGRKDRKAQSVEGIRQWVTRWSTHLKLNWTSSDIDEVTSYVNRSYYQLK